MARVVAAKAFDRKISSGKAHYKVPADGRAAATFWVVLVILIIFAPVLGFVAFLFGYFALGAAGVIVGIAFVPAYVWVCFAALAQYRGTRFLVSGEGIQIGNKLYAREDIGEFVARSKAVVDWQWSVFFSYGGKEVKLATAITEMTASAVMNSVQSDLAQ